jgi:hypothetical protein
MAGLALALAVALGHTSAQATLIARAIDQACGGEPACVVDASVYVDHESNYQLTPAPWSWDAKAGKASGPFQLWGAPQGIQAQANEWVRRRAASLAQWGDLRGLAGNTEAGVRVARARAEEARGLVWLAPVWGRD